MRSWFAFGQVWEAISMSNQFLTVKNLPETERPYERCEKYGAEFLSDAELLAVIIRTGTKHTRSVDLAHQILNLSGQTSGLNYLHKLKMKDLQKIKGIGKVKSIQILCVLELSRRIAKASAGERINFNHPSSIAAYYMEDMRYYQQEHLVLVMLDTKHNMIKDSLISKGSVNATIVDPRMIFIEALRYHAVNIILVHNHPSGDPTPSNEDIAVTKKIADAGTLLGIRLSDHIIIGDKQYESLHMKGIV